MYDFILGVCQYNLWQDGSQTCLNLLEEPLCHLSLMPIPEGGVGAADPETHYLVACLKVCCVGRKSYV